MTTLDLLEACLDAPPRGDLPPVAFTAEAVYECDRRGIEYRLPPDLIETEAFRARQGTYWDDELAWFELLDDLLWERLPELRQSGMRPALLCARWLKSVLDVVFIRGCELTSLISEHEGIDRIVLCRRTAGEPSPEPAEADAARILFQGPSVLARLLPLFAEQAGVAWSERVTEEGRPPGRSSLRLLSTARPIVGAQWRRWRQFWRPRGGSGDLTLLFLRGGYDLDPLMTDALAQGHRCMIYAQRRIFDVSQRVPATSAVFGDTDTGPRYTDVARAITAPESALWAWPDGWFDLPVSTLLAPRISYFIERILPAVISFTAEFREFFRSTHVDYVVAPLLGQPSDYGAMEGARQVGDPKRVIILHGDSTLDYAAIFLLEMFQSDHYFCASTEAAEFLRRNGQQYSRAVARTHVGSYRWRGHQRLAERPRWRRPPDRVERERPTVVYAITHMVRDQRYLFGNSHYIKSPFYSDPRYYNLQKSVVDVLARDDRFNVVVKLFPGDASLTGPIARYVTEQDCSHLYLSRRPFKQWLPWADRVILDFPSTAVYETAVAGVPLLCLVYHRLPLREEALEEVKPWIHRFSDPDTVAVAVAEYLALERPERPDMRPAGDRILSTLEQLAAAAARDRLHSPARATAPVDP